jgi:hypothetical protein
MRIKKKIKCPTLESDSDEAFSSSNDRELDKDKVAACDANGNRDKIWSSYSQYLDTLYSKNECSQLDVTVQEMCIFWLQ